MPDAAPLPADAGPDALVERLFQSAIGAMELLTIYVGDRLGLYPILADRGPISADALAQAAGVQPRLLREWLEQQAVSGFLTVDQSGAEPLFALAPHAAEVLTDLDSLNSMSPFARLLPAVVLPLPALLRAFREGGGVPYADYGPDLVEGQANFTRPMFLNLLGAEWLPAIPDLHARLQADPPARVADVACGGGLSSLAIARAYPKVHVDGIDLDAPSVELARRHLAGSGLEDRVTFIHGDAADPALQHRYDLVTIFEALHDMAHPVEVLAACRGLLAPGGSVLIGDERVGDAFDPHAGDVERLMYLFSVLHCLPVGLADGTPEAPSRGTGAVIRPATVRAYAQEAGFSAVEIAPIDNDFWRFYRLRP